MKTIILFVTLLSVACGSESLLKNGTYTVIVSYDVDYCVCPTVKGETDIQKWQFEDNVMTSFGSRYELTEERNVLVYHEETKNYTYHFELYPGPAGERFTGYSYYDFPALMLTIASTHGKLE